MFLFIKDNIIRSCSALKRNLRDNLTLKRNLRSIFTQQIMFSSLENQKKIRGRRLRKFCNSKQHSLSVLKKLSVPCDLVQIVIDYVPVANWYFTNWLAEVKNSKQNKKNKNNSNNGRPIPEIHVGLLLEALDPNGCLNAWDFFNMDNPNIDKKTGLIEYKNHYEDGYIIWASNNVYNYWDNLYNVFINECGVKPISFYECALRYIEDVAIIKWLNTKKYKNIDQHLENEIIDIVKSLELPINTHYSSPVTMAQCMFCCGRRIHVLFLENRRDFYCTICTHSHPKLERGKYIILDRFYNDLYDNFDEYSDNSFDDRSDDGYDFNNDSSDNEFH